ncbi:hypothetical protein BZZ01_04750 [Nostocales cyanobacterium HT-58-2]|nr:hypothetical protein BZZ01_04750 [Nostocales cyanobacterium HT-58-2]
MFDSVFDGFLQFSGDKLILGEKQVLGDLDSLESKSAALLKKIPLEAVKRSEKNIDRVKQILVQKISQALYSIWLAGWQLGGKHSNQEIEKSRLRVAKFTKFSNIVQFDDGTKKKGVQVRSIRNTPAENAIRGRINQLASDVSNSEFDRIRESLLAAVTPQPDTGEPISRRELLNQIEEILGTKSGRFARRAETIARTELTFAYNAGRLDTYRQSGLVSHVVFYTIIDERRCPICASRQGLVVPLDDWRAIAQNSAPLHPNCRCLWSAVLKDDPKTQDPNRSLDKKELVPRAAPWAAAGILAAVLLGGRSAGVAAPAAAITLATNQIREAIQEKPVEQVQPQAEPQQEGAIVRVPRDTPRVQVGTIDLNTATREELQNLLPGRSLNVRQENAIIRRREQQPFTSVEDLRTIPSIGGKTFERLKQLAEGNAIIPLLDPQSIRTPVQLWASNLGLTKTQADTIFRELQKGGFKDIEDLKQRLKGKGIGEQTIKNMQERAAIVQRRLPPVTQPVPVRVLAEGEIEGPSAPRTPAPYTTGTRPSETILPPTSPTTKPQSPTVDPLRQNLENIRTGVNNHSTQSAAVANQQLSSKLNFFDKSLNQTVSETQTTVDKVRNLNQQVNQVEDQLNFWDRRLGNLEDNYAKILDPTAPNYFEQAPQLLANLRSELSKAQKALGDSVGNNNQYINQIQDRINKLETKFNRATKQKAVAESGKEAARLRSQLANLNNRIQSLEAELTKLLPGTERSSKWLELQRLKNDHSALEGSIKTAADRIEEVVNPVLDSARSTVDDVKLINQSVRDMARKVQELQQRLEKLPTTKAQLNDEVKAKYNAVRELRTVQRQLQTRVIQFRQTESIARQNLEASATRQVDFYNRYDEQYQRFESSVSPVIERQFNAIRANLRELQAMPQGRVAWLLSFNGWDTSNIPQDLALVLPGAPDSPRAIQILREMAADLSRKLRRVEENIEAVKRQSEFRFVNADRKIQTSPQLLESATQRLNYWEQLRNGMVDQKNIGSTNNRLSTLWRDIEKARAAGDTQKLQELYAQISPDDAYGYSRKVLLTLQDWDNKYQNVLSLGAKPGAISEALSLRLIAPKSRPLTRLYQQYQEAKESFLQQLGNSRIEQSRLIEQGYQDAKDMYERIRYDASRVPVFDINGRTVTATELTQQLEEAQQQVRRLNQMQQMSNVFPANQQAVTQAQQRIDELTKTVNTTATEISGLHQQIDELQQQGRRTKRLEKQLQQKQQALADSTQQLKAAIEEIQELRLNAQSYAQLQQLKTSATDLEKAITQTSNRLATVSQQIQRLQEQQQQLGTRSQRGMRLAQELEQLTEERVALVEELGRSNQKLQRVRGEIQLIRRE